MTATLAPPAYRVSDRLEPFVCEGVIRPGRGYHGTYSYPTIKPGGYIVPHSKRKYWRKDRRPHTQYPGYSKKDRTYYVAAEHEINGWMGRKKDSWDFVQDWTPHNPPPGMHRVICVVEPEGLVDIDVNLWLPAFDPRPDLALTADRLRIISVHDPKEGPPS